MLWFPREGEPIYAVRKSYTRAMTESPLKNIVRFRRYSELPELLPSPGEVLGVELDVVPVAVHRQISKVFPDARFVDASMALRRARAVKTDFELDEIRRAAAMLDKAFLDIPHQLTEGASRVRVECTDRVCDAHGGTPGFLSHPAFQHGNALRCGLFRGQRLVSPQF